MKENKNQEAGKAEFFDALLNIAREATQVPAAPSTLCINQSRNFNNIKVNIVVSSPKKPGLLRRIFSKFF